jgi:hypothetical protein
MHVESCCARAYHREQRRHAIPIALAASPCPTARDFVPWRFLVAGRFSALSVSSSRRPKTCTQHTGGFKGPRAVDETGLPMHVDNQTVFKERIYRDKGDPKLLHDEMTMIDNALTRPWTVDKKYVLNPNPRPDWPEYYTNETNAQIKIGKENYFLSWDGLLMPTKKDQAPPDLRYFNQTRK